jgi:hypothetical protein
MYPITIKSAQSFIANKKKKKKKKEREREKKFGGAKAF